MPTPAPFFSSQVGANRVWRISNANSTVGFGDPPWTPSFLRRNEVLIRTARVK